MTKAILISAAVLATGLQAQNSFQNPSWMGSMNNPQQALRPDGQTGPVMGKPFSGVETRQTKQILSDGTPVNKETVTKIFRDAEGRMLSESGATKILFDAPALITYTQAKSCSKRSVRDSESVVIVATEHGTSVSTSSKKNSGAPTVNPNLVVEDLGFQAINGVSVQGQRQTLTIPATTLGADHDMKVVNERWYSESLGILIKSSNVDPRFGSTTYSLSNINQSTPDASLFTAPSGCRDSSPLPMAPRP